MCMYVCKYVKAIKYSDLGLLITIPFRIYSISNMAAITNTLYHNIENKKFQRQTKEIKTK